MFYSLTHSSLKSGLNLFLSEKQQSTLKALDKPFRDLVSSNLWLSRENFCISRLVLDILSHSQRTNKSEALLYKLLSSTGIEVINGTTTVLEIAKKGKMEGLSEYSHTKKAQYHSIETLLKIISLYNRFINDPKCNKLLQDLPPYDEGGKELVEQQLNPQTPVNQSPNQNVPHAPPGNIQGLMNFDGTFSEFSTCAIDVLLRIPSDQRISIELYRQIFSKIRQSTLFDEEEKITIGKVILASTVTQDQTTPQIYNATDFDDLLLLSTQLKDKYGPEFVIFFFKAPPLKLHHSIFEINRAMSLLLGAVEEKAMDLLQQFSNDRISLSQLATSLEEALEALDDSFFSDDLTALYQKFQSTQFPLSPGQLQEVMRRYQIVQHYSSSYRSLSLSKLSERANALRNDAFTNALNTDSVCELIAICRLSLRRFCNISPRNTQILALLGILHTGNFCLAQVFPGEGKTVIIGMFIFAIVMQSRTVDLVFPNQYLAKRDQTLFVTFFRKFNIVTQHICYEQQKPEHFKAHVLYGTSTDFEFPLMRALLYTENLFDARKSVSNFKRNFDCVIVEEVDNLLIDMSLNGARMAYPNEVSYQWLYGLILNFVKTNPNNPSASALRAALMTQVNEAGKNALRELPDTKLNTWIESASVALFHKKEPVDYVVKSTRKPNGQVGKKSIQIVDAEITGRISQGTRWSNGIHEFLEIKHGLEMEKESLTPVTLSHVVFYSLYQSIFGLSGTLGSPQEREEIKTLYTIQTFDVPPYVPSRRIDAKPVIYETKEDYLNAILSSVRKHSIQRRPVLILCSTILDSQFFARFLESHSLQVQILNDIQEELEEDIVGRAGEPGKITVATNVAGRGTDIKLTPESRTNGGLHTLFTFYPDSDRVYKQGLGRGGRGGDPGSSETMIYLENGIERILVMSQHPEQRLQSLDLLRASKMKGQQNRRVSRAKLETYCHQKIEEFFKKLNEWFSKVTQKTFLVYHSKHLSHTRSPNPLQINFEALSSPDRSIAKDCVMNLNAPYEDHPDALQRMNLQWEILLKNIAERIKQKVIVEWCERFHEKKEALVCQHHELEAHKRMVDELYNSQKQHWEKYLDSSGNGIFVYLDEIIGMDLAEIDSTASSDFI